MKRNPMQVTIWNQEQLRRKSVYSQASFRRRIEKGAEDFFSPNLKAGFEPTAPRFMKTLRII